MIRINKSQISVPQIFDNGGRGYQETEKMKADYDNGERKFSFSSRIYGHKTVKEILKRLQNHKCCFCEARINHISHGDVEHFRPKAGYNSIARGRLTKPGYYWLAYDFSNLFLACQICNQSYKRNYFPLIDETTRAYSHHDDYRREQNLILHPEHDDPEQHLTFEGEVIKPLNGSIMGKETIKRTGLNRKLLQDDRLELLRILKTLAKVA
jgi:uncharacterized protein (TIGR02646 family)